MDRRAGGRPRLLAPAGRLDTLDAVLRAGADAVYAGAGAWGRGGAKAGLDAPGIARAVATCRARGAVLQVALNAVPAASEIPALLALAERLHEEGVDAVVLNDPGVIALVRDRVPGLPICASVGAATLNPEDARFLRDLGASAVVLPVAVPLEDLPAIKSASGIAVEVFAWCRPEFIVQGKCGLTGYAGAPAGAAAACDAGGEAPAGASLPGRSFGGVPSSAKRSGRCHFVCRALPVPRSPRTIEDDLAAWIRAGADAFKIEGRDLPAARLAETVARIRRKLDRALAQA